MYHFYIIGATLLLGFSGQLVSSENFTYTEVFLLVVVVLLFAATSVLGDILKVLRKR